MQFQHINQLCDIVRETSFAIHCYLKSARIETVLLINFGAQILHAKKYLMSDAGA